MKNAFTIGLRELKGYFTSPVFYLLATVFLGIMGFMTTNTLDAFSYASFQATQMQMQQQGTPPLNVNTDVIEPLLGLMAFILLLFSPMVTMRSLAEEKKQKTFPLLLAAPIRLWEIVAGKFFACLTILGLLVLGSSYFVGFILLIGQPEMGPILTGYLGVLLMTSCYVSMGLFASSLTDNQLIAAVITFGFIFLMWIIGWQSQSSSPGMAQILEYLSLSSHLQNFTRGVIDTSDLMYYTSFTLFFLFLTHRVLESRRWR